MCGLQWRAVVEPAIEDVGPRYAVVGAVRASWFVSPRRSRAKFPSVRHVSDDEIQDEVHQLDALESSDLIERKPCDTVGRTVIERIA